MVLAFVAIVWTYSVNPAEVALGYDANGSGEFFLSRSQLFYLAAAIFLVNNVILVAMKSRIASIPVTLMPIPKRELWALNRPALNEFLANWLFSIVGVVNFVLGIGLFAVATVNSQQFTFDIFDFEWLYYVSVVLLLVVFVGIPLRLFRPPVPAS
jgi:hypothetical protein